MATSRKNNPVSIRLHADQKKKLKQAAKQTRLSEQDCIRMAIEFGLPALRAAIGAVTAPEK